jgi:hypothetical protein
VGRATLSFVGERSLGLAALATLHFTSLCLMLQIVLKIPSHQRFEETYVTIVRAKDGNISN